jgi:hypothetical protein
VRVISFQVGVRSGPRSGGWRPSCLSLSEPDVEVWLGAVVGGVGAELAGIGQAERGIGRHLQVEAGLDHRAVLCDRHAGNCKASPPAKAKVEVGVTSPKAWRQLAQEAQCMPLTAKLCIF